MDDNAAGAYAASLIGGYPTGASSLNLLYKENMLQGNYLSLVLLCSNAGPMFVLATIGTIMLGSYKIGVIIFVSHALGAIITSAIACTIKNDDTLPKKQYSKYKPQERKQADFFDIIECAIINTSKIMIKIFGLLCFFRLMSDVVFSSGLFGTSMNTTEIIMRGSLEMVDGCVKAMLLPTAPAAVLITFIISFGGLSAIFQSISVSKDLPYSKRLFIAGKLIHGFLSSAICYITLRVYPAAVPASTYQNISYDIYTKSNVSSFAITLIVISVLYMALKPLIQCRKPTKR